MALLRPNSVAPLLLASLLLSSACVPEPPPHADALDAAVSVALQAEIEGMDVAIAPLEAPFTDWDATQAAWWSDTQKAATHLAGAETRADASRRIGGLVATCRRCHKGDVFEAPFDDAHGGAFDRLQRAAITGNAELAQEAEAILLEQPDLGANRGRLLDLSRKIGNTASSRQAGRFYGKLVQMCTRCHGIRPDLGGPAATEPPEVPVEAEGSEAEGEEPTP